MSVSDNGTLVLSAATISVNNFVDGVTKSGLKRNEARFQVVGACAVFIVETMDAKNGGELDAGQIDFVLKTLTAGYYNQGESDADRAKKMVRTLILKAGTYADTIRNEVINKKGIPTFEMRQIMAGRAMEMRHKLTVTTLEKPSLLTPKSANANVAAPATPAAPVLTIEPTSAPIDPLAVPPVAETSNTDRVMAILGSVSAADIAKAMDADTLAAWAGAIVAEIGFREEAAKALVPVPATDKKKAA